MEGSHSCCLNRRQTVSSQSSRLGEADVHRLLESCPSAPGRWTERGSRAGDQHPQTQASLGSGWPVAAVLSVPGTIRRVPGLVKGAWPSIILKPGGGRGTLWWDQWCPPMTLWMRARGETPKGGVWGAKAGGGMQGPPPGMAQLPAWLPKLRCTGGLRQQAKRRPTLGGSLQAVAVCGDACSQHMWHVAAAVRNGACGRVCCDWLAWLAVDAPLVGQCCVYWGKGCSSMLLLYCAWGCLYQGVEGHPQCMLLHDCMPTLLNIFSSLHAATDHRWEHGCVWMGAGACVAAYA